MKDKQNERLNALEKELNGRGANGKAIKNALIDYYSIFDRSIVSWLGRLYDSKTGGFYYSNSARDNEYVITEEGKFKLLPDVESTEQALRLLVSSGIIDDYSSLPDRMKEEIKNFVCSLEDPDTGFFYHPQWTKEMVDAKPARRGRDTRWAIAISKALNFDFPYPTAPERLASMESENKKNTKIPEYLFEKSKFLEYLNSFDWENEAYYAGNAISAQSSMINAAGLTDIAIDFLNRVQNPSTGLWGNIGGHTATNAYLKISNFYTTYKKALPNTDKAINTVLECAVSECCVNTVCWQYNVWCAIKNIINNTRAFGGSLAEEKAKEILKNLYDIAPAAIASTKRKAESFKKEDGSFSFKPNSTSAVSQGLPVALKDANEGDINSTLLCTSATTENLFLALDLKSLSVPVFSKEVYPDFLQAANII